MVGTCRRTISKGKWKFMWIKDWVFFCFLFRLECFREANQHERNFSFLKFAHFDAQRWCATPIITSTHFLDQKIVKENIIRSGNRMQSKRLFFVLMHSLPTTNEVSRRQKKNNFREKGPNLKSLDCFCSVITFNLYVWQYLCEPEPFWNILGFFFLVTIDSLEFFFYSFVSSIHP